MSYDGPSSPLALRSSLPPSSAPNPSQNANLNGATPKRPNGRLPPSDAPAPPGTDEAQEDRPEDNSRRRRGRGRGQINGDVPLVRDTLGEQITESFQTFLETLVHRVYIMKNSCLIIFMFHRFTEEINLAPTPGSEGDVPAAADGTLIYVDQIFIMREHELTTLYIDYGHLLQKDEVLANAIQTKYYRFMPYLRRSVRNLVKKYVPEYLQANPLAAGNESINQQMKEFNVAFYHLPLVSAIRDLKTEKIGTLMSVSGTVTRTSEVRPELIHGSFVCEECGGLVNEIEQQFKYTEVSLQAIQSGL